MIVDTNYAAHCWNCGTRITSSAVYARRPSGMRRAFHERCIVALQTRGHDWERELNALLESRRRT